MYVCNNFIILSRRVPPITSSPRTYSIHVYTNQHFRQNVSFTFSDQLSYLFSFVQTTNEHTNHSSLSTAHHHKTLNYEKNDDFYAPTAATQVLPNIAGIDKSTFFSYPFSSTNNIILINLVRSLTQEKHQSFSMNPNTALHA